jgi:asparagine synthetase B (glutamine-hydrolysing)
MLPFASATSIHIHSILKQKIDVILTGFLGEFSGSHTWPELLMARSRQGAITAIFNRFLAPKLTLAQRVFQPAFFQRVSTAVRDSFYKSFEEITNDLPMNIADSWNFVHLQPRGTFHAPAVDRHNLEMRAPHTDNDLVDFLLTIPPTARLEQRVYKKMIAYSFPEIRSIPCTNSSLPIDPNFGKEYSKMVARFAVAKAVGSVRKLFRAQPQLGREFRDLSRDYRAEPELIEQILKPLLKSSALSATIFNHRAIDRLIHEHYALKASHETVLGLLISVGLALKFFLHDELSDAPPELFDVAEPSIAIN